MVGQGIFRLAEGCYVCREAWFVGGEGSSDDALSSEQVVHGAGLVEAQDLQIGDYARRVHRRDATGIGLVGVAASAFALLVTRRPS